MVIYIAGPYRVTDRYTKEALCQFVRKAAIKLWAAGHAVICPHMNNRDLELEPDLYSAIMLAGDLKLIERCDAVYVLKGYENSEGTMQEIEYAHKINKVIYYQGESEVPDEG